MFTIIFCYSSSSIIILLLCMLSTHNNMIPIATCRLPSSLQTAEFCQVSMSLLISYMHSCLVFYRLTMAGVCFNGVTHLNKLQDLASIRGLCNDGNRSILVQRLRADESAQSKTFDAQRLGHYNTDQHVSDDVKYPVKPAQVQQ